MDFDDLLLIGDVMPVAVGFPAFGDDLNEDATGGCCRNVSDAAWIGFDVDFGFFIFDEVLVESFYVDAGVLHRLVGVAARDFDGETWDGSGSLGRRSFALLTLSEEWKEGVQEESRQKEKTEDFHDAPGNMFA